MLTWFLLEVVGTETDMPEGVLWTLIGMFVAACLHH